MGDWDMNGLASMFFQSPIYRCWKPPGLYSGAIDAQGFSAGGIANVAAPSQKAHNRIMGQMKILVCVCMLLTAAVAQTNKLPSPILNDDQKKNPPPAPMIYSASDVNTARPAATAVNNFGLKMLTGMAAQSQHQNVFVSPLSMFTALVMTENGASGETRDAMRKTLAIPADLSETDLHGSASTLLKLLRSQKGAELAIANALWSDIKVPLSPDFIQRCQKLYEAEAATLDFSQPAAANTINNWVKDKTHNKIPSIVAPDIVRMAAAIITNAVYFHGKWQTQFPKAETHDGIFQLANGGQKKVPLMHHSAIKNAYRSGDGYEAAALPYESSGIEMYAILPAPGKSPEKILGKISVDKLRSPACSNELDLKLPRFTLDFSASLKAPLAQLGMGPAFQPRGDFAPLGSPKFYVGDVLHKTRLEVDEEGTTAAAVTAVAAAAAAFHSQPEKKVLVFNRPFALLLCDEQTGAILFAGVIYEPK